MTVTLEDVAILLGLPIYGLPICTNTDRNWEEVVETCLGVDWEEVGTDAFANKSALSLTWLRDTFCDLEDDAEEEKVKCYARAYILSLIGNFLFVETTGDSVSCVYLPFLYDLDQIRSYAWGAGVLARLYRQLCLACEKKKSGQIGGCMALLQCWILERFPVFTPKLIERHVLSGLVPETMPPRGYYWSSKHKWVQRKQPLGSYRELIDALQDENVNWMPYTSEITQHLPPVCMFQEEYWLIRAPLIDFASLETYHPERVMRQFGRYQVVPPPACSTNPNAHLIDRQKFPRVDWLDFHRSYVQEWNDHAVINESRPYDPEKLPEYLDWYKTSTIVTFQSIIGSSSHGGPVLERLERPELGIKKMVKEVLQIAKKAGRKITKNIDKKWSLAIFKMCRNVVATVDSINTFEKAVEGINVPEPLPEESEEESEGGSDDMNMRLSQMLPKRNVLGKKKKAREEVSRQEIVEEEESEEESSEESDEWSGARARGRGRGGRGRI